MSRLCMVALPPGGQVDAAQLPGSCRFTMATAVAAACHRWQHSFFKRSMAVTMMKMLARVQTARSVVLPLKFDWVCT